MSSPSKIPPQQPYEEDSNDQNAAVDFQPTPAPIFAPTVSAAVMYAAAQHDAAREALVSQEQTIAQDDPDAQEPPADDVDNHFSDIEWGDLIHDEWAEY